NHPAKYTVGRWYTFGPPEQEFAGWTNLLASYGEWKLVPTSKTAPPDGWLSAGWDQSTKPPGIPTATATGRCLNFEIGARKSPADLFFETNVEWNNFYRGFKGYVDHFAFGIDGNTVTYDFEPAANAAPPAITELSIKEAYDFDAKHPSKHGDQLVKV